VNTCPKWYCSRKLSMICSGTNSSILTPNSRRSGL
jgi:hypothetical protein